MLLNLVVVGFDQKINFAYAVWVNGGESSLGICGSCRWKESVEDIEVVVSHNYNMHVSVGYVGNMS